MSDRYRAVGRAVGRDGVGTVAIAKHTVDADAFASELNRLLDERDEAREEVRLLREEVAIADRGAEHPDAAAWREQVGTWCGPGPDGVLLGVPPRDGRCPQGWEWDDNDHIGWNTIDTSEKRPVFVRRIPAPPVEVGQWRHDGEGAWLVVAVRHGMAELMAPVTHAPDRTMHLSRSVEQIASWPLCDPDPRWETTEREARHG